VPPGRERCTARGEESSNCTTREREVYHHRSEGTTNHTVAEERGAQVALPDRGGGLNLCHRRGEVRTNHTAERILWLPC
jgi:hypothetical protein